MKTLRNKITAIVSIILIGTMGILTGYSIINSRNHFTQPILAATLMQMPIQAQSVEPKQVEMIKILKSETTDAMEITFNAVEAQKEFGMAQLLVMILIVLCGILLTYFFLGQALKPLGKLNKAATRIDANKLNIQIPVTTSKDEIATLTNSFNLMLSRLNNSFKQQKNFSQNAAHELKTPLSVMKLSLQVLELDETPTLEDYKENAQIVAKSTDELIEIVEQLLTLTDNVDIGRGELHLQNIINECIQENDMKISQNDISLSTQLEKVTIYANHLLIKSIVYNIISNAIKYNKYSGDIFIALSKDEEYAIINVIDTGIGIAENELDCICEPFFRADESRSKKIDGNGLGLSIVKTSMDRLNGLMSIESEIGIGTSVRLKFPLSIS